MSRAHVDVAERRLRPIYGTKHTLDPAVCGTKIATPVVEKLARPFCCLAVLEVQENCFQSRADIAILTQALMPTFKCLDHWIDLNILRSLCLCVDLLWSQR